MIIENLLVGDHLETDLFSIKETIEDKGRENILCIMSTTTCFAPRIPDKYVTFMLGITRLELERAIKHQPSPFGVFRIFKVEHFVKMVNSF